MKAVRLFLVVSGVVALLVAIAIGVAFNSSFQTWAARRALAQQKDLKGELGSLSAGLGRVEVRDLKIESRGAVLTLPRLDAELPLIDAGLHKNVRVTSAVAKGWTLDLSRLASPNAVTELIDGEEGLHAQREPRPFSLLPSAYAAQVAAAAAPPVFTGVFQQLRLPVDLSLDGLVLEGEVILPRFGGMHGQRVKVTLQGGGMAAGREGAFVVTLATVHGDGGALTVRSNVRAAMDTPRTFTLIASKSAASASGPQIPNGVAVDVAVEAARLPTGESYTLRLSGPDKPLADVKAELTTAAARIAGTWKLDLRDADVAPFGLGLRLPAFTAVGEGKFETGTAFDEIAATGTLNASVDRLQVLQAELSAIGPVSFSADFDVLQHGDSLRVERLHATGAAGAPVATVRALQSFEFNLKTAELRVADPAQDLVGISLNGLPVAWAQPFLGEWQLTGGDMRGEFAASARNGGLALRAKSPLTLQGVSLARSGEPMLRDVDLSLTASADYTPQGWQAQVVNLGLRSGGAALLSLDAKAGQLAGEKQPLKATGRWSANLAGWAVQPLLAGELQLASGLAQGDFSASLDGTQAIETKLAITDLLGPAKEKLPSVGLDVRADIAPDGKATFNVPLLFTLDGRKSDLLLAGTATPGAPGMTIDARITSELVVAEDVQLLALLLPAEGEERPKPKGADVPESAKPFWNDLGGQVALALKRVVYGGTFTVSDVAGTLKIEPAGLKLDGVRAMFGPESDVKLSGGLKFDAAATQPYALAADMVLNNFDTGPAFRALDPAKLPTIDARVNVTTHLSGQGASLGEVAERAQGRFELSSKGGVFRALATVMPEDRMQTAQSALSIVGGLLGGSAGETVAATSEIVKIIAEIPFDQLSVKAQRNLDLNLVLQDFSLISPDVRLGGIGQVTYAPGRPLLEQALDMQVSLGARGRLGELLNQVKLLKPEKDNLGYNAFSAPIRIGGTLAQTDTSDLKAKLLNVAIERSGVQDALNKILGGGK